MSKNKNDVPEQFDAHRRRDLKKPLSIAVIILLLLLITLGSFGTGMYFAEREKSPSPSPIIVVDTNEQEEVIDERVINETQELLVNWFDISAQPEREPTKWLVDAVYLGLDPKDEELSQKAVALGMIEGGRYDGYELRLETYALPSLGVYYQSFYLLIDPQSRKSSVLLDRYSIGINDVFTSVSASERVTESLDVDQLALIPSDIFIDAGASIQEFESISSSVQDSGGQRYWYIGDWHHVTYPETFNLATATEVGKLMDGRALYRYTPNTTDDDFDHGEGFTTLFYAIRADGRLQWFDLEVPFFRVANPLETTAFGRPFITWLDTGERNTKDYLKASQGGCGFDAMNNIVSRSDMGGVVPIGEYQLSGTQKGIIYGPERYDEGRAKALFDSWLFMNPEGSLEEFETLHPLFYFEDAFGRWIEFQHTSVMAAVECGKPVIYLYPEKKTDIRVEVAPRGGFSFTDPEYGDGWEVTAYPDGRLVQKSDGVMYPYLFWEGRGSLYSVPEQYFVVSQKDVPEFLDETLQRLGFIAQEIADFQEFWLPRMQDAPYYKIGFHGKEVMDNIAPLTLSEKPDTVIRILMDYSPLQEKIEANEPRLPKTPERKGFVVTEWGGVIR